MNVPKLNEGEVYIDVKENTLTDGSKVYDVILWVDKNSIAENQEYVTLAIAHSEKAAWKCLEEINAAITKAKGATK